MTNIFQYILFFLQVYLFNSYVFKFDQTQGTVNLSEKEEYNISLITQGILLNKNITDVNSYNTTIYSDNFENIKVGYKIDTLKISKEEINCSIYYNNTINNKVIGFGRWEDGHKDISRTTISQFQRKLKDGNFIGLNFIDSTLYIGEMYNNKKNDDFKIFCNIFDKNISNFWSCYFTKLFKGNFSDFKNKSIDDQKTLFKNLTEEINILVIFSYENSNEKSLISESLRKKFKDSSYNEISIINDEYIIKLGNIKDFSDINNTIHIKSIPYENFIIIKGNTLKEFQEIIFNEEEDKILFLNNSTCIDIYAFTTENKIANFLFYFSCFIVIIIIVGVIFISGKSKNDENKNESSNNISQDESLISL